MAQLPLDQTSMSTSAVATGAVLALIVSYVTYYRFLHPLASFPGPPLASLTNAYKFWFVATDQTPYEMCRLHEKYDSPVVRFGPNDLHFNHPDAVAAIYKSGWPKGDFYLSFQQPENGLFAIRDEQVHAKRRRMWAPGFQPAYIRGMEKFMDSRYALLRKKLDEFAQSGEVFDLRHQITYCIVDLFGELAFGQAFGNQVDQDPKKIPPVSEALYASCVGGQIPWFAPFIGAIRDRLPVPKVRELLFAFERIANLALANIESRRVKPTDREDILSKITAAREESTGEPLTTLQLKAELITLIVGGTHTTGNTLHLLLANLSRNPQHLKRVIAEIDGLPLLRDDQAAYGIVGLEEKLDFTNAAAKENFRKDPVGTFNMPRTVPLGGADVAGYRIPDGTQVCLNVHALHHNPDVWGRDHHIYDPTRWYDHRAKGLESYVIPFMVGKRNCVGQNLANANILKVTCTLLRAYEFDWINVNEPMKVVSHGDSELDIPLFVKCKMRGKPFSG